MSGGIIVVINLHPTTLVIREVTLRCRFCWDSFSPLFSEIMLLNSNLHNCMSD